MTTLKENLSKKTYTARDYEQDGLIWQLDGIENSAYGEHNAMSGYNQTIPNLADGGKTWFMMCWTGSVQFHDNYFSFSAENPGWGAYCPNVTSISYGFECNTVNCEQIEIVFSLPDVSKHSLVMYGGHKRNGVAVESGFIGCGNNMGYEIEANEIVSLSFLARSDYNDCYWKNGAHTSVSQSVVEKATGGVNNCTLLGGGYQLVVPAKYYSVRFYSRALNEAAIAHNFIVDKSRFGI